METNLKLFEMKPLHFPTFFIAKLWSERSLKPIAAKRNVTWNEALVILKPNDRFFLGETLSTNNLAFP